MNIETREIKRWDELSEAEKASGKWERLEDGMARLLGLFQGTYVDKLEDQKASSFRRKLTKEEA
jgi:hypothetical protein